MPWEFERRREGCQEVARRQLDHEKGHDRDHEQRRDHVQDAPGYVLEHGRILRGSEARPALRGTGLRASLLFLEELAGVVRRRVRVVKGLGHRLGDVLEVVLDDPVAARLGADPDGVELVGRDVQDLHHQGCFCFSKSGVTLIWS